jgi:hypothetical protein
MGKYSIDIAGLILIVKKGNDASKGHFFFLLNGEEVVYSCTGVSEIVLCISSPEEVDGVTCSLIGLVAKALEAVPVSFPDQGYDHGLSHFSLLQSGL